MYKNKMILFGSILVMLILLLTACAKQAATAPATTTQKPTATPMAAKTMEINILSTATGSVGYVFAFALAEMVNKDFPELKLAALEGKNYMVNIQQYIKEPENRKNTIYLTESCSWSRAKDGRAPFSEAAPGLKLLICHIPEGALSFISTDPNITRPVDLKGKRIATDVDNLDWTASWLLNYWGIFDTVRYSKIGYAPAINAVMDRTTDVAFVPVGTKYSPDRTSPGVLTVPLYSQKMTYFVNIPRADLDAYLAKTGDAYIPTLIRKGEFGGAFPCPQEDIWAPGTFCGFYADKDFDEEIAYKIVKTAIAHIGEFQSYNKNLQYLKTYMASPAIGEANFHPGALRAFKEAGLKIGERTP